MTDAPFSPELLAHTASVPRSRQEAGRLLRRRWQRALVVSPGAASVVSRGQDRAVGLCCGSRRARCHGRVDRRTRGGPVTSLGETAEPLNREDARILELESGPIRGHTLKILVVEGPEDPSGQALRAEIAQRLP